jgi:hypothetical protein
MRKLTVFLTTTLLVALLGAGLAACGGGDDDDDGNGGPTPGAGQATPGATSDGGGGAGGSNVTLTIEDGSAAVREQAGVILSALGVGDPGIGAWTVDVTFDPTIVSAASCDGNEGPGSTPEAGADTPTPTGPGLAFCNPKYENSIVRSTGAVVEGASGDVALATITFQCEAAGTSDLTINVSTFADATVGDPTDINHTEENGSITCS